MLEFGQCGPLPRHNTVMSCSLSFPPSEEQMQHFGKEGEMK